VLHPWLESLKNKPLEFDFGAAKVDQQPDFDAIVFHLWPKHAFAP
jgi:hypothetical protein